MSTNRIANGAPVAWSLSTEELKHRLEWMYADVPVGSIELSELDAA